MPILCRGQCDDPIQNLAFEEALCREAVRAGDVAMFLWVNSPCVVIGVSQDAASECSLEAMRADGVVLARRKTGGGAVYHDKGNLNYSFCAPELLYSERRQYGIVLKALRALGVDAVQNGRNDITASGRKLSGSAFRHSEGFALQHGTLMANVDKASIEKYLTPSLAKLASKGVKSVASRVVNLCELSRIDVPMLERALEAAFAEEYGAPRAEPQYAVPDGEFRDERFRFRSFSGYNTVFGARLSFGEVKLAIQTENGAVASCRVATDALDDTLAGRLELALLGKKCDRTELLKLCEAVYDNNKKDGANISNAES